MNTGQDRTQKFVIGTAQFGSSYGVANVVGQVSHNEVDRIFKYASQQGISLLDTAMAYGESEARIGALDTEQWRIISKLSVVPESVTDLAKWVDDSIYSSLDNLKVKNIYGLLLHDAQQLRGTFGKRLYAELKRLQSSGLIQKIGVSIYEVDDLLWLTDCFDLDIIQAPMNIFDRRLIESGWASSLQKQGVEVHVRSIFLQGLLLMSAENRPEKFSKWNSLWNIWHSWLNDVGLSALEATSRFAVSILDVDMVVIGVDSQAQLEEIITSSQGILPDIPTELICNDIQLINPSNWQKL